MGGGGRGCLAPFIGKKTKKQNKNKKHLVITPKNNLGTHLTKSLKTLFCQIVPNQKTTSSIVNCSVRSMKGLTGQPMTV